MHGDAVERLGRGKAGKTEEQGGSKDLSQEGRPFVISRNR